MSIAQALSNLPKLTHVIFSMGEIKREALKAAPQLQMITAQQVEAVKQILRCSPTLGDRPDRDFRFKISRTITVQGSRATCRSDNQLCLC